MLRARGVQVSVRLARRWYRRHARRIWLVGWGVLLVLSFILIGFGLVGYRGDAVTPSRVEALKSRFDRVVTDRLAICRQVAGDALRRQKASGDVSGLIYLKAAERSRLRSSGCEFLVREQATTVFWTMPFDRGVWQQLDTDAAATWINGVWYWKSVERICGYEVALLVALRTEYPITNRYLQSYWHSSLSFLEGCCPPWLVEWIDFPVSEGISRVSQVRGDTLPIGYLLLLIALFVGPWLAPVARRRLLGWLAIVLVVLLRFYTQRVGLFDGCVGSLFRPELFALPPYFTSLGEFFFQSVTIVGVMLLLSVIQREEGEPGGLALWLRRLLWCAISVGLVLVFDIIVHRCVINSTIPLTPHHFANLSPYALLVFVCISLVFSAAFIAISSFIGICCGSRSLVPVLMWIAILAIWLCVLEVAGEGVHISGVVLSLLLFLFQWAVLRRVEQLRVSARYILAIAVVVSLYVSVSLHIETLSKERLIDGRLVEAIGNERDLLLELSLQGVSGRVRRDSVMLLELDKGYRGVQQLYRYFSREYMSDYLLSYDCELLLSYGIPGALWSQGARASSYESVIARYGESVGSSDFYHINRGDGRISYLGAMALHSPGGRAATLYVELSSKKSRVLWGYPELLVEERHPHTLPDEGRSTALYRNDSLVLQSGEYAYPLKLVSANGESQSELLGGAGQYVHRSYAYGHKIVVITRPATKLVDLAGGCAFLAIVFTVVFAVMARIASILPARAVLSTGLALRIQRLILLVSGTIFILGLLGAHVLLKRELEAQQRRTLSERISLVHNELERWMGEFDPIASPVDEMTNWLLSNLSSRFYSDINLYDTDGWLVSSSRPEIFSNHLIGQKMRPSPWYQLVALHSSIVMQQERVGGLEYTSVYMPLVMRGRTEGYINIPHFTQPDALRHQYLSIFSMVLNVFILFTLLTFVLVLVFTGRFLRPLQALREGVSRISITSDNEPIEYDYDDEIGHLVQAYNGMLAELKISAEKLAQNERQLAWREMAQQIAHDIKNPLTPIKLNLQYLMALRKQGALDWEVKFDRFAVMLLEQIDLLSATASAFSRFAELSDGDTEVIAPNPLIEKVVALHSVYSNLVWKVEIGASDGVLIQLNSLHFYRVMNNLVTNAVQAIGDRAGGAISIASRVGSGWFELEVGDNGAGMDSDVQSKVFTRSFSTKLHGMGLGLAIVKAIVESAGGQIGLESVAGEGTAFTLKFPIFALENA